ncbi:MAG: 3-oxoadipate enol-lactonase [Pseudomonadota bacterium]
MQFADLGAATIRYRIEGDPRGPAILFANALGTDLTVWDEVVARLPRGYAMIGYDKRGHGLSSVPAGALSIDDHASDLLRLIDHLGVEEAVICGVSVGGMIAQRAAVRAAVRAPERVRGLILCNTGAWIGSAEMWAERMAQIARDGLEVQADAVMERWFTAPFRSAHAAMLAGYRAMLTRTPQAGYLATCAALRDADLTDGTRSLKTPTLCIAGDGAGAGDLATPPQRVRDLAALIEGAQYEELTGCGHLPMIEQPDACAAVIARFLETLDEALTTSPGETAGHAKGMNARRRVLGDAHVDRAVANTTAMDAAFQRFITEGAWGSVWSGRHFTLRERSIVTLALLAAAGQDDEVAMHLRATANTGATQADVAEALMHVAVYAGVPKANHALKIARQVLEPKPEDA